MIHLPAGLRVTSINPPSLQVRFESIGTKVVAVTPELAGDPARGYRVDKKAASPTHVVVRGPKSVIDAMTEVKTLPISVAEKSESFTQRATLERPELVTVVEAPPIDVTVQIAEEPAELGVAHVPVVVRLPAATAIDAARTSVEPAVVDIVLRGGRNAIEAVDKARVSAHVDLHAEDVAGAVRDAEIVLEGVPPGVAVEIHPRSVQLKVAPAGKTP
jgi:YbbR domain-containing protein